MENQHVTEFMEATEKWKKLERKTAKQREAADAYYEKTLLKYIEEAFIAHNKDKVYEKAEYLIMSVGTSFEPLVLSIQLLKPKRILFLYTELTERFLNKIVNYCKLDMTSFSKRKVNETEPLDIYREIKHAYLEWNKPEKLYIDFTGGTKSMSAAAAMAGALIDVQLLYVGSDDYLTDFRKPNPGSETLYYISNPLAVFGDMEIEKAFALFAQYNYSGACERLEELKESVPDPDIRQQLNFVYLMGRSYESWDALEFEQAYRFMKQLGHEIRRDRKVHGKFLLMDFADIIAGQEAVLEQLSKIPELLQKKQNIDILQNKEYMMPLMFTMYQSASVREKQEKYDMATLLLYRLLEMIEQRRLSKYQLYASKMDYNNMEYELNQTPEVAKLDKAERFRWLKDQVIQIRQQLFNKEGNTYLQDQVSLLDGFVILLALKDPISMKENGRHIDKLKRIRSMVRLRNNSIFAHGLGPVSLQDYTKFKEFVVELFGEFCEIEGIDYEASVKQFTWLNPMESNYYTGMGES